jgi:hypothetical protein
MRTPEPGSEEERAAFALLQQSFVAMHRRLFADESIPRTVVVVPSLTLTESELAKIEGVLHYEERMLCLLLLLRMPRTRVVYVTSIPLDAEVVDYHLGLIGDVPDARERLTLLSVDDPSLRPLTAKLLGRRDLLTAIRSAVDDPASAHLTCFAATSLERTLAVTLGLPMYAPDPALWSLGTKSEGRRVFREAGVDVPPGKEDVRTLDDIARAIADLRRRDRSQRVVVKLDEGFSGEGNVIIDLRAAPGRKLNDWVRSNIPARAQFEASSEAWPSYSTKLEAMGGVVEAFLDSGEVRSPSVQVRVSPSGEIGIVSTHDQVLGGRTGQVFLGCRFPADAGYRRLITDAGYRVAEVLARRGVIGRFGVDFLTVRSGDAWRVYGIEINLRKGGTTLPFLMLDYLTRGAYSVEAGEYLIEEGAPRSYVASDNVISDAYVGMAPGAILRAVGGRSYDHRSKTGVVLHLLGAVRRHGKFGIVAIADSPEASQRLFDETVMSVERAARLGAAHSMVEPVI